MTSATAVRPAYRPFVLRVVRVERLGPSFARIAFTGDEIEHFGTAGLDQRIKLLVPGRDGVTSDVGQDSSAVADAGTWYENWRALPADSRSPLRTYTVRRIDPARAELVVDFVLHHDAGPAGDWAASAAPGSRIVIVGPDKRSPHSRTGIDWHPGTAKRVLLVGDETAVPAIGSILESLGPDVDADVFVEVPHADDEQRWDIPEHFRVRWIPRVESPHGARLIAAVEAWCDASRDVLGAADSSLTEELEDVDIDVDLLWNSPMDAEREFYAWMAGESATVKTLRRLLVSTHGVDKSRVAFMGYWRLGQSERQA